MFFVIHWKLHFFNHTSYHGDFININLTPKDVYSPFGFKKNIGGDPKLSSIHTALTLTPEYIYMYNLLILEMSYLNYGLQA